MSVGDQFNIHVLAILAAVTSTLAKQIIFYVSYGGRKIISEKTKQRMLPFQKLVKKYGAGAAFFAAATPMIDPIFDMFGISSTEDLDDPTPILIGIIGFGVAMTVVVLVMLRLDWSRVLGRVVPWTLEDDDDDQK